MEGVEPDEISPLHEYRGENVRARWKLEATMFRKLITTKKGEEWSKYARSSGSLSRILKSHWPGPRGRAIKTGLGTSIIRLRRETS